MLNRSGHRIDLDIVNFSFGAIDLNDLNDTSIQDNERIGNYKEIDDNMKERIVYKVDITLYAINPNQQESVIADITNITDSDKCKQVLWKLVGDELRPGNKI